jgi:hypothetical protein
MKQDIENAISSVMKEFTKTLRGVEDPRSREALVDGVIDGLVDKEVVVEADEESAAKLQIVRKS